MKLLVDRATLVGFRQGDGSAFAKVIRAYTAIVRSQVTRYWHGAFQVEEAMQEVWVHAYKQRQGLDPERLDEFGAWLARLARNRCIDLLRKEGRTIGPDTKDPSIKLAQVQNSPDQMQKVLAGEIREALDGFKAKLKPHWHTFFVLHFEQGLGYPEIASRLAIGRTRCKYMKRVLLARARRNAKLRSLLGRSEPEEVTHAR